MSAANSQLEISTKLAGFKNLNALYQSTSLTIITNKIHSTFILANSGPSLEPIVTTNGMVPDYD